MNELWQKFSPYWLQTAAPFGFDLGLPALRSSPDQWPASISDPSAPPIPSTPLPGGLRGDMNRRQDQGLLWHLSRDEGSPPAPPTDSGPLGSPYWPQTTMAFDMGLRRPDLPAPWPGSTLPIPSAPPTLPSALPRSGWDPSSPSLWHPPFGANARFPAPPISDDPFERAAFRTRQSVQPDGGRLEGAATTVLENYLPHAANQLQTLPQRAFEASERHRLTGQYDPGPAVETALMMLGLRGLPAVAHRPGIARRAGEHWDGAMNPMASKSASLYNPPVKPQRPFELDYPPAKYPHGAPADATGRLTRDIEGRPLVAERVVGRRTLGGPDEALTPAELDPLAEKMFGRRPEVVAASSLPRGAVGKYDPNTGRIVVLRDLPAETKDMVAAHEMAHGINHKAGDFVGPRWPNMIPIKPGMPSELKSIYNDLNNPNLAKARANNPDVDPAKVYWGTGVTPERNFGYSKAEAPGELMAEAVRAYLASPNYMKTVAPRTAAQIREWWNSHPIFSKYLQLNSAAGAAGAGLAAGDATSPASEEAFWNAWRRGDAL